MIFLIDNDIVLKLSKWDLLAELIQLLGVRMEKIYRLPSCQYVLSNPNKPAKALKRCGNQATIDRISAFCEQTSPIPAPKQSVWLELLNAVPDIDVGEVIIFAIGIEEECSITFIGDKRSLVALAAAETLKDVLPILSGRAKCLEQIMAELVVAYGLDVILNKVRDRQDVDKAMNMVFGKHPNIHQPEDVWKGLESYYMNLCNATNGLLAKFPDPPAIVYEQRMDL